MSLDGLARADPDMDPAVLAMAYLGAAVMLFDSCDPAMAEVLALRGAAVLDVGPVAVTDSSEFAPPGGPESDPCLRVDWLLRASNPNRSGQPLTAVRSLTGTGESVWASC